MKKFLLGIIFIFIFSNSSIAYIKIGIDCASLVNQLGGLNKIDILWLENLNEKKYQYVLINLSKKNNNRSYYLCGNKYNINATSDKTMNVLSERNLQLISKSPVDLFTEIFSLTSKGSRKYIMQRLNVKDFGITRNELNQAYTFGLMKLAENLNPSEEKKDDKIVKIEPEKKIEEPEQEKQTEITIKTSKDKTPPKIIIAKNLTFGQSSYKLEGKVEDEGSKRIFVEIDGQVQEAINGNFVFERFSPVDETVKIIATDQWGNRSKEKIVKIKIDNSSKSIVKKLEKLEPNKINYNQIGSDKVAIVIGIEKYDKAPQATYASADAKFFHEYARLAFGVSKENIKLLTDEKATYIDTLALLKKWLPAKINKNRTELIIFFAGHGLANTESENNELYILSQNSDPDMLDGSAISRTKFFKSILDLEPKKVTIFIDACYSGVSRDEKTLLASARPLKLKTEDSEIPDMFTVFSASGLNEISSGLKEAKHGIFSYFLMKGLEGKADENNDKKITNGELLSYMKKNVSVKAAELGRKQNPSLSGDPDAILVTYR